MKLHNLQSGNFTGIHFRYNPNDFFAGNPKIGQDGHKLNDDYFANLLLALKNPRWFLDKTLKYVEQHHTDTDKKIIITSPLNIADLFYNHTKLGHFKNYSIITSKNTKEFLESKRGCEPVDLWFGEILSILEKEILVHSGAFLRARPSNWSFNIQGQRMARFESLPHDRYMFDIFMNGSWIMPSIEELKIMNIIDDKFFEDTKLFTTN